MESSLARCVVVSGVIRSDFTDTKGMVITIIYKNVWITPVEDITDLPQPILASLSTTVSKMAPRQTSACEQSYCSQITPKPMEIHPPECTSHCRKMILHSPPHLRTVASEKGIKCQNECKRARWIPPNLYAGTPSPPYYSIHTYICIYMHIYIVLTYS